MSIKKYDVEDRMPPSPLLDAPRTVTWKLRATWAIRGLTTALGIGKELDPLDAEWDSAQRALSLGILGGLEHKDPAHRAAAERLKASLLSGGGTGQTGLKLDQEVDFGRHQLAITKSEPLSADVKTVGVQAHLERIQEATEALAAGLGRGPGQNRAAARSTQIREALTECSATFNAIHDEIVWLTDHTAEGEHRDQLKAFLAPFDALLLRYPPPKGAAAAGAAGTGDTSSTGAAPGTGTQTP